MDGRKRSEGSYADDVAEGEWSFYDEDGRLEAKGAFVRGDRSGPWVHYESGGLPQASGEYHDNQPAGVWSFLNAKGEQVLRKDFSQLAPESRRCWIQLNRSLFGPPSEQRFGTILEVLERWPEQDVDEAIRFSESMLVSWPDDNRYVPGKWTKLILWGIPTWNQRKFPRGAVESPEDLRRLKLWPLTRFLGLWRVQVKADGFRQMTRSVLAGHITQLGFESVWVEEGYGDVLIAPGFPSVTALTLRDCGVETESLAKLAESPQGQRLVSLSIEREEYKDKDLAILFGCAGFERLREFRLQDGPLGENCAAAIRKDSFLSRLEQLELWDCDISVDFLRQLGALRFERLRSLRLNDVKLETSERAHTPEEVRTFIGRVMRQDR